VRRSLWAVLFVLLALPIVFGVGGIAWVASLLPPGQAPRVRGPDDLVGLNVNGSYAWVVPVADGVVLIDAGLDAQGAALRKEIAGRPVLGVLLTHAHADHTAGLAAFPEAPVWVGAADQALLDGEGEETSPLALGFRRFAGPPPAHGPVTAVEDGAVVTLGGEGFRAAAAPGVTPGSVAWQWRGVLFTGDAVWGGGALQLPPDALCEVPADCRTAPARLLPLDFDTVADGQIGITGTARPALFRLLGTPEAPPTVPRPDAGAGGSEATGWVVRAPTPDARGERPEWLVRPGRPPVRLSDHPTAALDAWAGRWATLVLREEEGGAAIAEARTAAEPEPTVPPPDTGAALAGWVDRWTPVEGTVRAFAPLAPGSAWGEGTFALRDGTAVPLHAPAGAVPAVGPERTSILARVVRDGEGFALVLAPPVPGT
jgi:glyoxylase-like metal-dependent hydrolase (beta-lactamase superfamily II)